MATWETLRIPADPRSVTWKNFHENSKVGRFDPHPSDEAVIERMRAVYHPLPYSGRPRIALPAAASLQGASVTEVIFNRRSSRELGCGWLSQSLLATLLRFAYGRSAQPEDTSMPVPLGVVPSGGALYPLELYCYCNRVNGIPAGIHYYDSVHHSLRRLSDDNVRDSLAGSFRQPELALGAAVLIFITAVFQRSTFKYGPRGYRFATLEAGHVAQNLNLVATAAELPSVNIGGFYDRDVDDLLQLDGIDHSTIYIFAVGGKSS